MKVLGFRTRSHRIGCAPKLTHCVWAPKPPWCKAPYAVCFHFYDITSGCCRASSDSWVFFHCFLFVCLMQVPDRKFWLQRHPLQRRLSPQTHCLLCNWIKSPARYPPPTPSSIALQILGAFHYYCPPGLFASFSSYTLNFHSYVLKSPVKREPAKP